MCRADLSGIELKVGSIYLGKIRHIVRPSMIVISFVAGVMLSYFRGRNGRSWRGLRSFAFV